MAVLVLTLPLLDAVNLSFCIGQIETTRALINVINSDVANVFAADIFSNTVWRSTGTGAHHGRFLRGCRAICACVCSIRCGARIGDSL